MLGSVAMMFVVGGVPDVIGPVPTDAMSLGALGQEGAISVVHDRWVAASGSVWATLAAVWGASAVVWAFSTGYWRLPRWDARRSLRGWARRWLSCRRLWLR